MSLRLFPGLLGRLSCRPAAQAAQAMQAMQAVRARGLATRPTGLSGPRLDAKQFFTPLRRPAPGPAPAGSAAGRGLGAAALLRRAFGTSKPADIIRTQWTRGQRGRGSQPKWTWWRRMRYRLDMIPAKNMVSCGAAVCWATVRQRGEVPDVPQVAGAA